jgi:hypothetical protein
MTMCIEMECRIMIRRLLQNVNLEVRRDSKIKLTCALRTQLVRVTNGWNWLKCVFND